MNLNHSKSNYLNEKLAYIYIYIGFTYRLIINYLFLQKAVLVESAIIIMEWLDLLYLLAYATFQKTCLNNTH